MTQTQDCFRKRRGNFLLLFLPPPFYVICELQRSQRRRRRPSFYPPPSTARLATRVWPTRTAASPRIYCSCGDAFGEGNRPGTAKRWDERGAEYGWRRFREASEHCTSRRRKIWRRFGEKGAAPRRESRRIRSSRPGGNRDDMHIFWKSDNDALKLRVPRWREGQTRGRHNGYARSMLLANKFSFVFFLGSHGMSNGCTYGHPWAPMPFPMRSHEIP